MKTLRYRRITHVFFFLFLCICVCTCPGATYYVDANRPDDTGDGTTWLTAKHTIQAAVDLAGNADTVLVTNGVYYEGGDFTNRVYMTTGHECTLLAVSTNPPDTVINGLGTNRCVRAAGNNAKIIGFMLTNGCISANGGGAHRGTLSNCWVTGCTGSEGGGVSISVVYNSRIIGNVATNTSSGGGGVHWAGPVYNSIIANNTAPNGGGLAQGTYAYNCIISNNHATVAGGGVYTSRAFDCLVVNNRADSLGGGFARSTTASNCVVRGNTAVYGGAGGYGAGYYQNYYNCLIVENQANRAGGVYQRSGLDFATLINCTVVSNIALQSGWCAGCSYHGGAFLGPFIVTNSIIRYNMNTADGVETNYAFTADTSIGYSLTWPDVSGAGYDNGGNVSSDPVFADGHDFKVLYRSPCVDSGINISTLSNDLDNVTRPVDGKGNGAPAYDMGCYEYIPPPGGTILNFR